MDDKIVLYTSNKCKRCDIIKMFLKEYDVPYIEVTDKQIMLEKEFESVPVLEHKGEIIKYEYILQWLKDNGYDME